MSPPDRLVTRFPNYFSKSLFCECDIRFAAYYLPYISRFEADESKSDVTDIAMLMKLYYIIIMGDFLLLYFITFGRRTSWPGQYFLHFQNAGR